MLAGLWTIDADWRASLDSAVPALLLGGRARRHGIAPLQLLVAAARLRRLLRRERVDVLYACEGHAGRFVAWLATRRLPGTTLVWGMQGSSSQGRTAGTVADRILLALSRAVSASVPLTIAAWETSLREQTAAGFRSPRRIAIRPGVDAKTFAPDPISRARLRAEWNAKREPLVGLVARLVPEKGVSTFLEAARLLLAQRRDDVRFVLVGPTSSARLDLPTALGLLAPDVKLTLINAKDKAFDKTAAIYKLAGAEGKFERK